MEAEEEGRDSGWQKWVWGGDRVVCYMDIQHVVNVYNWFGVRVFVLVQGWVSNPVV